MAAESQAPAVKETPQPAEPAPTTTTPTSAPSVAHTAPSDRIAASPMAKALAAEKGIALSDIKGTGPNGRIVKDDVLKKQGKFLPS